MKQKVTDATDTMLVPKDMPDEYSKIKEILDLLDQSKISRIFKFPIGRSRIMHASVRLITFKRKIRHSVPWSYAEAGSRVR